ncbi:MAG: dipeptide ABC transporter ATP-binding protein [Thioalkalispiraceae bacterium]|jgi:peptide/nickel transport system ATP-binding protein
MAKPLIKIEQLRTYLTTAGKTIKAVDDISFTINKGETYCLVGESGSGKSITALSIMRLLPKGISHHPSGVITLQQDTTGELDLLTVEEEQLKNIRGSRIAMIFQEPMNSLNPVYTIGEQIIEALQIHWPRMSENEAREKAIGALREVQIPNPEQRVDEYPHRLSGGQRQRVMIAMAMACEPDLLIADEPTTALDVTVQAEILRLMQELQKRKAMSILFITHDFGVVAQIGHKLGVMRLGKIVEQGSVQDVLESPQHDYTRQLLAALPENLKQQKRQSMLEAFHRRHPANETENALIKISNLQVYFPIKKGVFRHTVDHVKAVDDVSLTIRQGQIMALVGESGCGKTTLGRCLLRLVDPTGGCFSYNGTEISSLSPKQMLPFRKDLQFIFQDPISSLNPRLNIAATLTEPMAVHGIGETRQERIQIAQQVLEQVQLDPEFIWRYPHEFSGGQRQRIGVARSLVLNPKFIVCDEVTSALDVSVQAEILDILLNLRDKMDLTLLFITHNISVVEYISDEIAVMYKGRIVEHGDTDKITTSPQHDYTKKLLSAVPRLHH